MLARDEIRGGLFMTAGAWNDGLERVPSADEAVETFLRTAEGLIAAGVSCVLEYVVRRHRPADLDRLLAAGPVVVVMTRCDDPMARFRDRNRSDRLISRPAVLAALGYDSVAAHTEAAAARMAEVVEEMQTEFPLPTIHVDTTSGYRPALDDVVEFVTGPLDAPG